MEWCKNASDHKGFFIGVFCRKIEYRSRSPPWIWFENFNQIKKHGGFFMSKFIIEIKMANGESKKVKVYVDNRIAELLNQCDARVSVWLNKV